MHSIKKINARANKNISFSEFINYDEQRLNAEIFDPAPDLVNPAASSIKTRKQAVKISDIPRFILKSAHNAK